MLSNGTEKFRIKGTLTARWFHEKLSIIDFYGTASFCPSIKVLFHHRRLFFTLLLYKNSSADLFFTNLYLLVLVSTLSVSISCYDKIFQFFNNFINNSLCLFPCKSCLSKENNFIPGEQSLSQSLILLQAFFKYFCGKFILSSHWKFIMSPHVPFWALIGMAMVECIWKTWRRNKLGSL